MEATSFHRPDVSWVYIDRESHVHRWQTGGQPATSYSPTCAYTTPTLVWVKDGEEYWDGDDEPHPVGHLECAQCGDRVTPGYRADDTTQYVPGLRWFRINGHLVTPEEYDARWRAAVLKGTAQGQP